METKAMIRLMVMQGTIVYTAETGMTSLMAETVMIHSLEKTEMIFYMVVTA